MRNPDELAHEGFRFWTKGEIDASPGSEEIGNNGITTALDSFEKQRRTAFGNYAPVNFSQLQIRIDLCFDGDDFVFAGNGMLYAVPYGEGAGIWLARAK